MGPVEICSGISCLTFYTQYFEFSFIRISYLYFFFISKHGVVTETKRKITSQFDYIA